MVNLNISGNLGGLLERGVQVKMDAKEVMDVALKAAIGYAGSIGTSLWSKIKEDRAQVGLAQFFVIHRMWRLSGTIALFTHFSLFFPLFRSLTHIPLS